MTTAVAPERAFPTASRGEIREHILRTWRVWLRTLTNPDTGAAFTETEIATATSIKSRFWIEADAIDLALLSAQQRALYLADQVRVDRAGTSWLESYHAEQWGEERLPAYGAGGNIRVTGRPGTIAVGSATIGDPIAMTGVDPSGKRYQLLSTITIPVSPGYVDALFKAIDTGPETNLVTGTVITWATNVPVNLLSTGTVQSPGLTGGASEETDAEFSSRIASRIANKPGSGNSAHFRSWGREVSSAIEDVFVYPCALHAGSVIVSATQKRSDTTGPLARIPSAGTIADLTSRLTPPASPVVPTPPYVLVVAPTSVPSNVIVTLALPRGSASGYVDLTPWPETQAAAACYVSAVTSQTQWRIDIPAGSSALPSGVTAPSLQVWDATASRFELLQVQSVTLFGGLQYDVVLSAAPSHTMAPNDWISPGCYQRALVAETIEAYFDSLGPGEVIDLTTDPRAHRAWRSPSPEQEWPQRAGAAVLTWLLEALGSAVSDTTLELMSVGTPTVPTDPITGPSIITLSKVGVYYT